MTNKSFLSFKLHHFEEVAEIELNICRQLGRFSSFSTRNVSGLRIEEFLQTRYHFVQVKRPSLLRNFSLRQVCFRLYCDKEIGLNKILWHILLEFGVSSFWDSSAWKRIIQGLPRKELPGTVAAVESIFSHAHTQ